MATLKFLLAGESWVSSSTHYKGWDFFSSTLYETGIEYLEKVFHGMDIEFIHMPSHIASKEFPSSIDALNAFDVIALSDIGCQHAAAAARDLGGRSIISESAETDGGLGA